MTTPNDFNLQEFSNRFSTLINGTKKAHLYRHINASRPTVRQYIKGQRYPSIMILAQAAKVARFNMYWLLFGNALPTTTITIPNKHLEPLLSKNDVVEYSLIDSFQHLSDGLYVIEETGRKEVHRLVWDLNLREFKIYDNLHAKHHRNIAKEQLIGTNLRKVEYCQVRLSDSEIAKKPLLEYPLSTYLIEQGLDGYQDRLSNVIKQESITQLAFKTDISRNTLKKYIEQTAEPDITRLVRLAKSMNQPLQSILFSETKPWHSVPHMVSTRMTINDDYFSAIIPRGSEIEYLIIDDISVFEPDVIYVLSCEQNLILRRVMQQDSNQEYVVFGDNPIYPKQNMKQVNVIGKVTAMYTPL
ncbi:helix-turn-helix domain-containing protein [Carnobacterium maltaromaticum]|uniref:helix-turn-helix domain-containing protein n=1 Tax=Carnobacterium maltaromaticum TaxID=2751 RepID=UPI000C77C401|nr:hypothetical protein CYV32_15670 [Carnobacterium maltaromaticum]